MPVRPNELVVAWASLDALLGAGVEDLLFQNWEEVEVTKDEIPLSVDWDHYRAQERLGTFRVIAAHVGSELVGYSAWFINCHTRHKDHLFAICDEIYLVPERRRGWNGVRLIRTGERLLRERGVRLIQYGERFTVHLGARGATLGDLLKILGYKHTENVWTKMVGEGA